MKKIPVILPSTDSSNLLAVDLRNMKDDMALEMVLILNNRPPTLSIRIVTQRKDSF